MTKKQNKTRKQCPNCQAFVFQGPHPRGEIHGNKMVVREEVYTCLNCHNVAPIDALVDVPTPDYNFSDIEPSA